MGLSWLNPVNWFRPRTPATTTTPPAASASTFPPSTAEATPATGRTAPTSAATKATCAATTAAGTPCRSPARQGSKYCGRHKGHRAGGAATRRTPAAATASRGTATGGGNGHVAHGEYRLYRKGNRYFFSKKSVAEARQGGAAPVATMPSDRIVVVTPNGLPVLKKT